MSVGSVDPEIGGAFIVEERKSGRWRRLEGIKISEGRKWAGAAAVLAILAIGVICVPEDASVPAEAGNPQERRAEEARQTDSRGEGQWNILGAEMAAEGKETRNPFSLMHEDRGTGMALPEEKTEPVEPPLSAVSLAPVSTPPAVQQAGTYEKEPAWVLKGILSGEEGRLAILSNGKETVNAVVGEKFGRWVVQEIGEDFVRFSGDHGGGELRMPGI